MVLQSLDLLAAHGPGWEILVDELDDVDWEIWAMEYEEALQDAFWSGDLED